MTAPDPVIDTARTAHRNGFAVVPPREDGTKRPIGSWKQYQTNPPTDRQLTAWYKAGNCRGVGIITGTVSGGAELLELEGRAMDAGLWDQLWNLAREEGHAELLDRVAGGYTEDTPSGGIHLLYRVEGGDVPGNEKLARSASGDVLIETRGEGGYVITAPSNGGVHPSGDAWVIVSGGFDQVATITRGERDTLHNLARRLDQYAQADTPPPGGFVITPTGDDPTPWDRFNATTTAHDVLTRAGFTLHSESPDTRRGGTATHYTRPGKSKAEGSSVTVWADGRTTIFSSSVPVPGEVDDRRRLSPWQLHTHLNHGGDFEGAARLERIGTPATSGATVSERPATPHTFDPGGIVFDEPDTPEALWGIGADVLAAVGEPTIIYAATGIGKTTLAQRVALAAIGIGSPNVLGYPVNPTPGNVLYIAADRPRQAIRSLRRMVTEADRDTLDRRWRWERRHAIRITGDNPRVLLDAAQAAGASAVVLDSIKDLVAKISTDEGGQAYNDAVQTCIANEVDVIALHHPRKATAEGRGALTLDDVYGSTWITAGAGSVIALNGKAGEAVARLVHLKMPAEQVGPFDIDINYDTAEVTTIGRRNLEEYITREGSVTTKQALGYLTGKDDPTDAETKKVRRMLARLVKDGAATRHGDAGHMTVWESTAIRITPHTREVPE